MSKIDLKAMYIFPGQGGQYRGMGEDLCSEFASARAIYDKAGEVLGYDMAELSFRDPENKLGKTRFTQPALLTHEIACLEVFKELTGNAVSPAITAGHSLGEYSALVAAGALSFENALRLVKHRGEVLSEHGRGRMVVFKLDAESIQPHVERHFCGISGCNLPEQTVVGGAELDLKELVARIKETFGVDGIMLNVEGAFHTYLMTGAAEAFKKVLVAVQFGEPTTKILSNYTGHYHSTDPSIIKAYLFFQIFYPVRWFWGMRKAFSDGVNAVIEFGGGIGSGEGPAAKRPNLASITKTILKKTEGHAIYQPAINSGTLRQTAHLFAALRKVVDHPGAVEGGAPAQDRYDLYVPVTNGMVTENAVDAIRAVSEMSLDQAVQIVAQTSEQNLERVSLVDQNLKSPQPYLEKVSAGTPASPSFYFANDIAGQFARLRGDAAGR